MNQIARLAEKESFILTRIELFNWGGFHGLHQAAIHQELETARKQQQSLQPVALSWDKYQKQEQQLADRKALESLLPIWFAQQASQLWREKVSHIEVELGESQTRE